ncbi:HNH endonuclease signature motif containing protein, partial [Amnibacterium endophyticum]
RTASNRRWVGARPRPDGQATLTIESTATDVAAMYDAIRQSAVAAHGLEGECRTLGQLMADCAADMILQSAATGAIALTGEAAGPAYPMERLGDARVPGRKKIDVTLLVTVPATVATGAADGLASVAGMGDVDADVARRIVQHTTSWTRIGVDPIDDTVFAIDSHERYIPAGLKKLIHAKHETCVGDGCGLPAHRCDLDHAHRYEHDGRTRHDNLQALCRWSHLVKDEGFVDVRLDPDGTPRWASKWGAEWTTEPTLRTKTGPTIRWADDGTAIDEEDDNTPF